MPVAIRASQSRYRVPARALQIALRASLKLRVPQREASFGARSGVRRAQLQLR